MAEGANLKPNSLPSRIAQQGSVANSCASARDSYSVPAQQAIRPQLADGNQKLLVRRLRSDKLSAAFQILLVGEREREFASERYFIVFLHFANETVVFLQPSQLLGRQMRQILINVHLIHFSKIHD